MTTRKQTARKQWIEWIEWIEWTAALALAGVLLVLAQPMAFGQVAAVRVAPVRVARVVRVAQVKDNVFAGTEKFSKGASDVTEINIDPKSMDMLGSGNPVASLAHKMNFIFVHTYTYDKPGMYSMEDVAAYSRKLEDGSWHCSIHVKDKNGTTDICSRPSPDHESTEMIIMAAEPTALTFIHMSGRMSLDDLDKMGGSMGGLKSR